MPARVRNWPAATDVIHSPGATTSGLHRPSRVGPFPDVHDTPKVSGASRWVEPTVMQLSAWPGSVTVPISAMLCRPPPAAGALPPLPDDTTTTTPEATSSVM